MTYRTRIWNDGIFRWIGVPATGIFVYMVSGLSGESATAQTHAVPDFCYFSLTALTTWIVGNYCQQRLQKSLTDIPNVYLRLGIRYLAVCTIGWLVTYYMLHAWNAYVKNGQVPDEHLLLAQLLMVFASVTVSSIYEIVHLSRERESDIVHMERAEKLKVQAQLDALKSQIDPHFIFNSLNTLSYLITNDAGKAKLFNDTLAKVYRYILLNKEKDVVALKEEIEFASNYFYLLKIRYQTGLSMRIRMDDIITGDYLIPPLSLQALIENAIKHNHFSEKNPLQIDITISENEIRVENARNPKKFDIISSKIGLANLNERYNLIVQRKITVTQTPQLFSVTLPLLKS